MKTLAKNVVIILGTAVGLFLAWRFRGEFLLFFLAVILASILAPFSETLHRRGIPYAVSVLAVYATLLLCCGVLLAAMAGPLLQDFTAFFTDCGHIYRYVTENWPKGNLFERFLAERIPSSRQLPEQLATTADLPLMMQLLGIGGGILDLLLKTVLILVIAIYYQLDYLRLERLWLFFVPLPRRKTARDAWREVQKSAGDYLRSKLLQSLLAGFILGVAGYCCNFPYPVATAICVAILLLIPWLGPPLGIAVLWIASYANFMDVTPLAGLIRGIVSSLFAVLLMASQKAFVEPRLIEKKKYNSLLVFLATLAMMYLIGFVAIILGPPVAVALQIVGGQFINPNGSHNPHAELENPSALKERWEERILAGQNDQTSHSPMFLDIAKRWNALLNEAAEKFNDKGV
jgi:predicted PurR-regulated permease PerM